MPKLTMPYLKLLYRLGRIRTKPKKVFVANGERMSDEEFNRCMAIVNQCKQSK